MELNKKLAEWAGFTWTNDQHYVLRRGQVEGMWKAPASGRGTRFYYVPDFTQSLDACFKWLVPKLLEKHRMELKVGSAGTFCYIFRYGEDYSLAKCQTETSALALCLAIEKLIEGGN